MSTPGLTLTRHIGEAILIGDNIRIVVKRMNANQVTIQIQAPKEIAIWREELVRPGGDTCGNR